MNAQHLPAKILSTLFLLPFLIAGLYLCSLGFSLGLDAWRFKEGTLRAEGKVVNFKLVQSYSNQTNKSCIAYYPVVSFPTPRQQDVRFVSKLGSCAAQYKKFDIVPVVYHPQRPEHHAEIDGFWTFWFGPVLATIMGICFTVMSSFCLLYMLKPDILRRRKKKDA